MDAPATDTAISATEQAYRASRLTYRQAGDTLEVAALADAAYRIRQLYPAAAGITADSFRNEDGDDVLRLRGIWDQGGRRLAAIDDDADDALDLADDPDNDKAVDLAEYRGDQRHTLDLPTAPPSVTG